MGEFHRSELESTQRLQEQQVLKSSVEVQESDTIKQIKDKMVVTGKQEGFDESLTFIKTLPEVEQKYVLSALSEFKAKKYISNNGFPNSETYSKFKENFKKEEIETTKNNIQEDKKETQKKEEVGQNIQENRQESENQVNKKISENISQLKLISGTLSNYKSEILQSGISKDFLNSLEKATGGDTQEYEKIKKEILGNNGNLEKILKVFLEIDKKNAVAGKPTQLFKEVAANFSSFDTSLSARIEKFKLENQIGGLQTAQINATLGINSDKKYAGNFVYNNERIAVDLSKNPPEAFVSSTGGYRISLDMPVREFYPATVRFEESRQRIEPQMKSINNVGDDVNQALSNMKGVETVEDKKAVVNALKIQLRSKLGDMYNELKIDEKHDVNDIIRTIKEKQYALQNELKQAEVMYHKELADISRKYAESQKKQKEAIQDRLNFISSIGFDVVPQYITDMILAEVNRGEYGPLVSEPIDLANGNFGVKNEDTNRIAPNEKQAFIKLFNKMMSGEEGQPINPAQYGGEVNVPVDKANLKEKLAASGVFPNKEKWDINKIRDNLKKGKEK